MLKKMQEFKRVSIHIASQNQFGHEIPSAHMQQAIEYAREQFCHEFGGFTETRGLGGWRNLRHNITMLQNVVIIESMAAGSDTRCLWLFEVAETIRTMLGQNCVLIAIGDKMALIDGRE